jgi:hypothetical protein
MTMWPTSQSTYIPRVPQCRSPRLNWDSPTPSPTSECAPPPPGTKGGYTVACWRGGGRVPIRTTEGKAEHSCLLCGLRKSGGL